MRMALAALLTMAAVIGETPITVVGEFSNMRFTKEHAYGYTVQLWRHGDTLFGLFLASDGLAGDTPAGMLEDVTFDRRSGKVTFKARLSIGMTMLGQKSPEPSRDVFEFQGTLDKTGLSGLLKRSEQPRLTPGGAAHVTRITRITLRPTENELAQPASYAAWKQEADKILRVRGPKW